jgi:hypothetical protein
MRVLAASFRDDASARAARARLIAALALDANQISVEALANEREAADAAILAGRFQEQAVEAALQVVAESGGTMVYDIDDRGRNG